MNGLRWFGTLFAGAVLAVASPQLAFAHCDTMDGPVIHDARLALEQKDVTPVLKWIKPDNEAEIKAAFAKTLTVRRQGADARDLADRYFFETLVRVHRAGEGAPYTGLKPAGTEVGPAIEAADKALETGSLGETVKLVTDDAAVGIRKRFALVRKKKQHAGDSVEAGREFVAAYVDYVHYVEGLHRAAEGAGAHHAEGPETLAAEEPGAAHHH